ncbi:unnamed protein product, partial [Meganyctiphanes norvegica]
LINDDGTIDKLRTLQYNELVTCLVHTINNRMPKKCKDCNELYKIDIGSQPLFRCMLCNVGMHNCKKMDKNLMVSGLSWMCHGCSVTSKENNIIENAKMQIINKTINGNQLKGKIENKRNNEVKEKIREKRKREENEMNTIEVVAEVHGKENQSAPEIKQVIEDKQENVSREGNMKEQKSNVERVCSFWVRGRCKFGVSCNYAHPVLCTLILENGTCQKRDCEWFHPKMCNVMKQTGQCHRGQKCYFTHFRQTHNSSMTSREENQRTFNNPQTWGKTPSTYQNNYNQQWHPNMRNHNNSNQYNQNNQMRGPNMDFFPEPEHKLASDDQADNGESSRNPCRKDVGQHPMTKNKK